MASFERIYIFFSLQDGRSALHWAVLQNKVEIVQALLSASQAPHPSLNKGDAAGNTPLHYSVMYGKEKVFKFLMNDNLASGLNIDKANHVSLGFIVKNIILGQDVRIMKWHAVGNIYMYKGQGIYMSNMYTVLYKIHIYKLLYLYIGWKNSFAFSFCSS